MSLASKPCCPMLEQKTSSYQKIGNEGYHTFGRRRPRRQAQLRAPYGTIHRMLKQHLEGHCSPVQQKICCDIRAKCALTLSVWLLAAVIVSWLLGWCKPHRKRPQVDQSMKCPICFSLLYRPVTLPCGHTACESCCAAWFHKSDLAIEERVCFSGCGTRHGCLLPNVTLHIVEQLEQHYPVEYAQRGTEASVVKYNDLIKLYRAKRPLLETCKS
jgi:zinc finger of C3HC4-type, RING